jgi:hypothetical protein
MSNYAYIGLTVEESDLVNNAELLEFHGCLLEARDAYISILNKKPQNALLNYKVGKLALLSGDLDSAGNVILGVAAKSCFDTFFRLQQDYGFHHHCLSPLPSK